MSDAVDVIADLATRIADIRRRLRDLETERASLRSELDGLTAQFTAKVGVEEPASGSAQIDGEILRLLRRNPDSFFSSVDIESFLRRQNFNVDSAYIRTKLSRLAKRGKIRRVGHGRYADRG